MNKTILTLITTLSICAIPAISNAVPSQTAVPEPSTVFAGALLLAPLGISAVRAFRNNRRK